jgi:glycosyltransferase involved in cell wall biosynthesis
MRKTSYLITVGVPTRNNLETIERCIKSLIAQSYANIKIAISDNCSSDGSSELLRKQFSSHPNVELVQQELNIGAAANFANLLRNCETEYFMWLGGDDFLSENFIEVNLNFLVSNPDYIASSSMPIFKSENLEVLGVSIDLTGDLKSRIENFTRYANRSHNVFYSIFRTEKAKEYPYLGSNFAAADWAFDLYLLSKGKICTNSPGNIFFGTGGVSRSENANRTFTSSFASKFFPMVPFSRRALWMLARRPSLSLNLLKFIFRINWVQFKVDCNRLLSFTRSKLNLSDS